jgi:hypothetical protein
MKPNSSPGLPNAAASNEPALTSISGLRLRSRIGASSSSSTTQSITTWRLLVDPPNGVSYLRAGSGSPKE